MEGPEDRATAPPESPSGESDAGAKGYVKELKDLNIEDWFSQLIGKGNKMAHSQAIMTTWSIWKQRNAITFRENRKGAPEVFEKIKDTCNT